MSFKAANTTLQVNITASCSVHDDCYYYVSLIKGSNVADEETVVKKVTYYTDGNEWRYTFIGLTVGETYHLDFSKNYSCSGCIDGEGQVTKII